jgi:hypothetical protein
MRDVILAAAGEADNATLMPARETSGQGETREDISAQLAQARSAGEAEGIKHGSASERARIKSIITSNQAKGREELAHYFAFDTELAADTVLSALSKSPAAKPNLDSAGGAAQARRRRRARVWRTAAHDQHRRGLCPPPCGGGSRLATLTSDIFAPNVSVRISDAANRRAL